MWRNKVLLDWTKLHFSEITSCQQRHPQQCNLFNNYGGRNSSLVRALMIYTHLRQCQYRQQRSKSRKPSEGERGWNHDTKRCTCASYSSIFLPECLVCHQCEDENIMLYASSRRKKDMKHVHLARLDKILKFIARQSKSSIRITLK